MNEFQSKLYKELIELTTNCEAFYYVDRVFEGRTYRIFTYRITSYTEFMLPSALNCRGTTFDITYLENMGYPTLVCLPMGKFFNITENPSTMGISEDQVEYYTEKRDGSLISTVKRENSFIVKSKSSFESQQAIEARRYLLANTNKFDIKRIIDMGYTLDMEWTSPSNRIVLGYTVPTLTVLCARSMNDGSYMSYDQLSELLEHNYIYMVKRISSNELTFEQIKNKTNEEGYVATLKSGQRVKIKNDWYCRLHRLKEDVNNDKHLFFIIVNEQYDELISNFSFDPMVIEKVNKMVAHVGPLMNSVMARTEKFYKENKDLSRKEFAIKGQAEATDIFYLIMIMYSQKEPNYKEFFTKKYIDFIKDFKFDYTANTDNA